MFALQMWAFTVIHELPYDDPERLRRRLRVRYPIRADRAIGLGELPNIRLQRAFSRARRGHGARPLPRDRALGVVRRAASGARLDPRQARRSASRAAARQMAAAYDLGCVIYFAVPTAPPWWAAEQGVMAEQLGGADAESIALEHRHVRRVMVEVGEGTWGRAWPRLYQSLGGNPWAAMPSLHFATSLLAAILLAETGRARGRRRLGLRGDARVRARLPRRALRDRPDRRARPSCASCGGASRWASPSRLRISDGLQRLERIANS